MLSYYHLQHFPPSASGTAAVTNVCPNRRSSLQSSARLQATQAFQEAIRSKSPQERLQALLPHPSNDSTPAPSYTNLTVELPLRASAKASPIFSLRTALEVMISHRITSANIITSNLYEIFVPLQEADLIKSKLQAANILRPNRQLTHPTIGATPNCFVQPIWWVSASHFSSNSFNSHDSKSPTSHWFANSQFFAESITICSP